MTQEYMAGHMIHLKGEKDPILQCMPSDAKDNHNKSHTICSIKWEKWFPKLKKKSANLKNGLNKETDIACNINW